ncbi:M20/M25/M40 family metallo-hydrolase [Alkalicoccus chagannorensis]|uniref:M20/M25/M40 family metallo-hydrolase n=1 Tax=Alkalicoccus chagannorensis TaxID=427072 RepID=UPI0004105E6D|nr:M20/M25/M40 family metallo-hydrolase [Alkalicoccus chagannorensis]
MWQTTDELEQLLLELTRWESRTLTQGEREFPLKLQEKIRQLPYFQQHKSRIRLHEADHGRRALTALYRSPEAADRETVVLLSHFDTVQTEEYGQLEPFACDPEALTQKFRDAPDTLPAAAREDLLSGEYLFGRGTMDMKMGLALHMQLLARAAAEQWKLNLLLVTVPDEEVDSAGMRAVVPELPVLEQEEDLHYTLFLNSEPSFTQQPGDNTHYIYSGSMGKIMPGALFFGKETHAGEPLSGITAAFMSSYVSQAMEWNPAFREQHFGEQTPLPVALQLRDLKSGYSTQTPYRAAALYNVFTLKQDASQVMTAFTSIVEKAMQRCQQEYDTICRREGADGVQPMRVLRYEELEAYVREKFEPAELEEEIRTVMEKENWDEREQSIRIVGEWMLLCPELAPAVVLFFAPPYYPPVNASEDERVQRVMQLLEHPAQSSRRPVRHVHYFNGICDLSYVGYSQPPEELDSYRKNTPVWGRSYTIPFEAMRQLDAPVLNVGPFGKDPHQRTERLHRRSAFEETPGMLASLLATWGE